MPLLARPPKHSRTDDGYAFLPDTGGAIPSDDAESLAEEFIASVTGADDVFEDARNELSDDELGSGFQEEDITLPGIEVPLELARLEALDAEE